MPCFAGQTEVGMTGFVGLQQLIRLFRPVTERRRGYLDDRWDVFDRWAADAEELRWERPKLQGMRGEVHRNGLLIIE